MALKWLGRWLGGGAAPGPAPVPVPGAPVPSAASASAASAPSAAPKPVAPALRRPLVDRHGRIGAFEFVFAPALLARWRGGRDAATVAEAAVAIAAVRAAAAPDRPSLLLLDAALLEQPGLQAAAGPGLMVAPLDRDIRDEHAAAWRRGGARVGVRDGPPAQRPPADFVLLLPADGGLDTLLASADRWQRARPGSVLVAPGLAGVDEVEQAIAAGVALAGGRLGGGDRADRAAPTGSSGTLDPAAHRICDLMNLLALERDTAEVAEAFRRDAALAYRVLRFANSPVLGLSRPAESVEQAIALLGRGELQRWLAVLLMSAGRSRPAASAVQEHALTRGFVFEELARRRGEPRPQALFTLGLLSQADRLLGVSMAAALQPLRLPDELPRALLRDEGPWAPYVSVARALDGDELQALEQAASSFGGAEAVLAAAAAAWPKASAAVRSEP